jgi:hypothetical protein
MRAVESTMPLSEGACPRMSVVTYLPECPEYRLEGDLVHVVSRSGETEFHMVLTINQLMCARVREQRIIDQWVELTGQSNVVEFPRERAG